MLTFIACLLPVVASVYVQTSENYFLDIDDNTLNNVRFIENPHPVLNCSGMDLQAIKEDAFDKVPNVLKLDISNNSLTILPQFIFSNLTTLEILSLANNKIQQLENLFTNLRYLKLLDISRNPINELKRGSLFGLPKYSRILIDGNNLDSISTDMFNPQNVKLATETLHPEIYEAEDEIDTKSENAEIYRALDDYILSINTRVQLCKINGIVMLLNTIRKNLRKGCVEVPIDFSKRQVDLHDQNITSFSKSWYQLVDLPIVSLDLSSNMIGEIKKEILSKLSIDLPTVNVLNIYIPEVRRSEYENDYLRQLNFQNNWIHDIEDNAFANISLHDLNLNGNRLRNLNFVSTLPDTMTKLTLYDNRITSIPNNAFSRLSNLSYLNLGKNLIETLQNDVFQYLTSLKTLILASNVITTIEPTAFKGLTALKILDLQNNSIRDLQESNFAMLTALKTLNLNRNKIVKVTYTYFPRNLDTLYLEFNEISALEENSFAGVPKIKLFLSANSISRIARGAFNIPDLRVLSLNMNRLTTFERDITIGMGWGTLRYLLLRANEIPEIRKDCTRYLGSLHLLDISSNPFQKLESGALYGLSTDVGRNVYIKSNNLKEIQVGLFDEF